MLDLDGFVAALVMDRVGERSYRVGHMDHPGPTVFGGQMLAQAVAVAARIVPGHEVKSLHTVFCRAASSEQPLEVDVDLMHQGRSFSSLSVSMGQGGRTCARSLVLMESAVPDLIRHGPDAPDRPLPEPDGPAVVPPAGEENGPAWWDVRLVDDADISDPEAVGPAQLGVWTRFPGARDDPMLNRALLAYASDGFLIGTAMRPHPGFGQSLAHVAFATTVLTHTLCFHEPFRAAEWLLLDQEAPYAGRGRSYGRAHVFQDGRLVASFVQEAMIRSFG